MYHKPYCSFAFSYESEAQRAIIAALQFPAHRVNIRDGRRILPAGIIALESHHTGNGVSVIIIITVMSHAMIMSHWEIPVFVEIVANNDIG